MYDLADEKARSNIKYFGNYKIMIEGGRYKSVWLETQPIAGAMYAKRNIEIAANNQLIFMDFQINDGRLLGAVGVDNK
jgi:hypothetical protein